MSINLQYNQWKQQRSVFCAVNDCGYECQSFTAQTTTLLFSSVVLQRYRNVILETITAEGKIGLQRATTVGDWCETDNNS